MNISMLGDIAFTGIISEQAEKNIERYRKVVPFLNSADMVFANLEVPVKVDASRNEYKNFIHYSLPGPTKDLLAFLNIGCVSLANNHVFDCKMPGLQATINILDESGIFHTGAGWLPEHVKPVIINKANHKIAFMAYVDKSTNPKTENFPELLINYFDIEKVVSDIESVKNIVDRIIISIHWGKDYSNFYTKNQQEAARLIIGSGADVIMGHHPHTIQPYEIYENKLILYSLGQLCFGDILRDGNLRALNKKTKLGIIAKISFNNGNCNPVFIPTIERENNYINIANINIDKKLNQLGFINKKIHAHKSVEFITRIKETVFDRFYDYFFGYYRNFTGQMIGLVINFKKIRCIIKDYKRHKKD